jgi:Ion channel
VPEILAGVGGLALLVAALADVFQSVIVPRSVGSRFRPSVILSRHGWRLWRNAALRLSDAERREDTLALFAPSVLTLFLATWVSMMIVGYGLIFWALRAGLHPHPNLASAIYFAGTTLTTIGYGDIVPATALTRVVALCAAASGLGVVAVVATFLFQTFAAFQRREAFVVTISVRTGAPPSGLEFVKNHVKLELVDDIDALLREAQRWISEVMETHLAYPILGYFRSSHDDESWVGTLGALLDACTLLITTLEIDHRGQAELTLRAGAHLVHDFAHFFNLPTGDEAGVEYDEFVAAYRTMREMGIPLRPLEDAWPAFAAKRALYATSLDSMARWWRIPPARWIGDRSRVRLHINAGIPR